MDETTVKRRTGFYISEEMLAECDRYLTHSNSRSRNELVTKAIDFYIGYLKAEENINYLAPIIKNMVGAMVEASEDRIVKLLFKVAVELGKISNMLAAVHDVDKETLDSLQLMCVNEVKKINGIISFEKAVRFQKE